MQQLTAMYLMSLILLGISTAVNATGVYLDYDIYKGDIDNDGDIDYYFHRCCLFQNMDNNQTYINAPPSYVLYFDSSTQHYIKPIALVLPNIEVATLSVAAPTVDYHIIPDINGD